MNIRSFSIILLSAQVDWLSINMSGLGSDLSKTKYLGDICLNPNLPHLEEELKYREKQLDSRSLKTAQPSVIQ